MFRKLCMFLIVSKLEVSNHLIYHYHMHNLYAIFAKFLDICKQMAGKMLEKLLHSVIVPHRVFTITDINFTLSVD